jgi:hypothetical protein
MRRTQYLALAVLRVLIPFGAQGCMLLLDTSNYRTDAGTGGATGGDEGNAGADAAGADATTGPDAAATPGTLQKACTDLHTANCNKLDTCAPFLVTKVYGAVATCIQRNVSSCLGTAVASSAIEGCAQALPLETCNQFFDGNDQPAACNYVGPVPNGGACGELGQCDGLTAFCQSVSGQTCGVCSARLPAGSGCSDDAVCQNPLSCVKPTGATVGTCTLLGAGGATCNATHPCQGMLVCPASGVCGPALSAGAACTGQDCDIYHGVFCNASGVCEQFQASSPGASCGVCAASGFCRSVPSGSTNGTCVAAAADGAACDTANGPLCMPPATCVSGICQLPVTLACP